MVIGNQRILHKYNIIYNLKNKINLCVLGCIVIVETIYTNNFFVHFIGPNPYANLEKELSANGTSYKYFDIAALGEKYGKRDEIMISFVVCVNFKNVSCFCR